MRVIGWLVIVVTGLYIIADFVGILFMMLASLNPLNWLNLTLLALSLVCLVIWGIGLSQYKKHNIGLAMALMIAALVINRVVGPLIISQAYSTVL